MSSPWSHMQTEMHRIARDHGWWEEPRTPPHVLMLMVGELADECSSEFTRGGRWVLDENALQSEPIFYAHTAVAEELADFVIRLGDAAEEWRLELTPKSFPQMRAANPQPLTDTERLFKPIAFLARAAEEFRQPTADRAKIARLLTQALDAVIDAAAAWGMDLQGAVFEKMERNRHREHRHGNKVY